MTIPVLVLKNIHFLRGGSGGAGDSPRPILNDINWAVEPSQIAAVLGANGSGKSTLLRIAAGYLWPQKGSVELLGKRLGQVPLGPLRARIGIVEATTVYPFDEQMTAHQVVLSGYFSTLTLGYVRPPPAAGEHREHARQLLEHVGLGGGGGQGDQLYSTLSTGERLRALLARALVRRPELLLLDEPTAGLDLPARETLLATLTRLHRAPVGDGAVAPAIITITHHLEELLPETSNVLLLSAAPAAGNVIASGEPGAVLTDANLSAAYGVPIHVSQRHGRYTAHVDPRAWEDLIA